MIHEVFPVGLLACNCSLIADEQSKQAIVIDPGAEVDDIVALLHKHHLHLELIVVTHAHIDHIGGAAKLRALTGAPVAMNREDQFLSDALAVQASWLGIETPENPGIDHPLAEGDKVTAGSTELHVLHTPGHTPGSTCLWIPGEAKLIAGDTLFRDSVGRTDLPGGSSRQLIESIHTKLLKLPGDTVVIPGHGPSTTIERERRMNPFLQGSGLI